MSIAAHEVQNTNPEICDEIYCVQIPVLILKLKTFMLKLLKQLLEQHFAE